MHCAVWTAALLAAVGALAVEAAAQGGLYQEDPAATDPLRTQQARDLEAYLARLRDDRSALAAAFPADHASPAAYERSARGYRRALARAIGYPPPGKPDPGEPRLERIGEDSVAVYHRITLGTLPGVSTVGLYIVPRSMEKARRSRRPLVVSMHGGGGSPELATFNGGANYHDMVRGAVARGCIVWAPQHLFAAAGYPPDVRQRLDSRARMAGTSIVAIEVARITRGLDALLKRPEVDASRVAMVGLSYGGFYTLYTAALEPRIRVAVSSCWFGDGVERWQSSEPGGWPDVRFAGGWSLFRDPDVARLICPRALEIQMGVHDDLFPIGPARSASGAVEETYRRLGIADRYRFVAFEGGHEFHGPTAWEWLDRHLK